MYSNSIFGAYYCSFMFFCPNTLYNNKLFICVHFRFTEVTKQNILVWSKYVSSKFQNIFFIKILVTSVGIIRLSTPGTQIKSIQNERRFFYAMHTINTRGGIHGLACDNHVASWCYRLIVHLLYLKNRQISKFSRS